MNATPAPNQSRNKSATQYPAAHKSQVGACVNKTVIKCVLISLPTSLSFCLLTDENCRDVRQQCELVVQARLCVYTYYKKVCCASCVQSAQRAKRH